MNTSTALPPGPPAPSPSSSGVVAVDVADPDLDADVRAVLAALSMEAVTGPDAAVGIVVTDRPGAGGAAFARVVRVGSDQRPGSDDDDTSPVIHLPSGTGDLVTALLARESTPSGPLVVVRSAVGGCGASTLAAAIAIRAARSTRPLLVEADPRGTGIDLLLGAEDVPGLRVEDVRAELGGPDPDALWSAVPRVPPGLGLLARSRDVPAGEVDGVPGAVRAHRSAEGLVVCDHGSTGTGSGTGSGPGRDSAGVGGGDLVVVVTRADIPGAVAARRAVTTHPDAVLVVRTGRADPLHAADVADAAGARRWFVLPEVRAVRRAAGAGDLVAALSGRGGVSAGRSRRVRHLTALADVLLREVGIDER